MSTVSFCPLARRKLVAALHGGALNGAWGKRGRRAPSAVEQLAAWRWLLAGLFQTAQIASSSTTPQRLAPAGCRSCARGP